MAFLLLLHEKMRLKRKVNTMTLRQAKLANRKSRIADKITKMQKMFSKQTAMLEKNVSIWSKQFSLSMYNSVGLGQNNAFNPLSSMMGGGMMSGHIFMALEKLKSDPDFVNKYGNVDFEKFINGKGQWQLTDKNDQSLGYTNSETGETCTSEEYKGFQAAISYAQTSQMNAQNYCQRMAQEYESNASIWLEYQKQMLEEQQEEMLAPLEVEQEDIEMETAGLEIQLQDARARLEALEQACSQEIKDSVPKFGLG